MGKKGVVPTVYKVYRDRMAKHSNWKNKLHYSEAKTILGYYGIPKEVRQSILQEMFRYELLIRDNQHWVIIKGAKKKSFLG